MSRILIIDDEVDIRDLVSDILVDEGHIVTSSKNAALGLAAFESQKPDLVILDIWLEGSDSDGIGVLKRIKNINPDVPVLMISGHGNIETAIQTIKLGAYDFIEKPFKTEKLTILVKRALETYRLKQEINSLISSKGNDGKIDGHSKTIKAVLDSAKLAASANSRIVIYGELGTGKEALARYVHANSARASEPFVPFYPFGLAADAIEEELLGREGSGNYKIGLLEKANSGSLFIDEIRYLPAESQALLLKILQENAFSKLESKSRSKADFRLIVASSFDLNALVEAGEFSKSLFYRINVVPLYMPKLSERRDDVVDLVMAFNSEYAHSMKLSELKFREEALIYLRNYGWPGNIRQLKNTIEWLMIMYGRKDVEIGMEHLPHDITGIEGDGQQQFSIDQSLMMKPLKVARDIFEKEYFKVQLSRFAGSISKTAEFVEMDRAALHRKLKNLNVSNE